MAKKGDNLKAHQIQKGEVRNPHGPRRFRAAQAFLQAYLNEVYKGDTRIGSLIDKIFKDAIGNGKNAMRSRELLLKYAWALPKIEIEAVIPQQNNEQEVLHNLIKILPNDKLEQLSTLFEQQKELGEAGVGETQVD